MQTAYESSLQIIKDNNAKMCHLIIDIVKAIIPEAKIVPEKLKQIEESFHRHELGNIDINALTNLYCKGNKNAKNRNSTIKSNV